MLSLYYIRVIIVYRWEYPRCCDGRGRDRDSVRVEVEETEHALSSNYKKATIPPTIIHNRINAESIYNDITSPLWIEGYKIHRNFKFL